MQAVDDLLFVRAALTGEHNVVLDAFLPQRKYFGDDACAIDAQGKTNLGGGGFWQTWVPPSLIFIICCIIMRLSLRYGMRNYIRAWPSVSPM